MYRKCAQRNIYAFSTENGFLKKIYEPIGVGRPLPPPPPLNIPLPTSGSRSNVTCTAVRQRHVPLVFKSRWSVATGDPRGQCSRRLHSTNTHGYGRLSKACFNGIVVGRTGTWEVSRTDTTWRQKYENTWYERKTPLKTRFARPEIALRLQLETLNVCRI